MFAATLFYFKLQNPSNRALYLRWYVSPFNQHGQGKHINVYPELYSLKMSTSYRDRVAITITAKADKHAGTLNAGKSNTGSGTYEEHNAN
jgi:hypothetical protein